MTINISGILKSPQGSPIQNAEIIFEQTRTSTEVLAGTKFSIITNQSGNYSTTIGVGTFVFKVRFQDEIQYRTVASNVIVTQSMNNYTLNQIIQDQSQLQDVDYDLLQDVIQARDQAAASAQAAQTSQSTASAKASEASSSAQVALASKNQAQTSEANALQSKNQAYESEQMAQSSQAQANLSQGVAQSKASEAANSAAEALSDKNAAQQQADSALSSKTQAESFQQQAGNSQSQQQQSQGLASSKAQEAQDSQVSQQSNQLIATNKADQASTSQAQAQSSQSTSIAKAEEAATSQSAAQGSQILANTKAQESSQSQVLAQRWAANPENTEVSGGLYSALHYAAKAAQSAQTATGQLVWRGGWSAQSGTTPPTPSGTTQDFYRITQAGTILGVVYEVGDYIHWDNINSIWFKMDGTDSVVSINGRTGQVSLDQEQVGALPTQGTAVQSHKLATARNISITGDGTGSTSFDGATDQQLSLNLKASGVTPGVLTKVTVNQKGIITQGEQLQAQDIPNLDWSKITTGKPTTLQGYGITDAISTTGIASAANRLAVPRQINGTNFDGSQSITTEIWGTSRQITIGGAQKLVNGGSPISWTLNEIGAAPDGFGLGKSGTQISSIIGETPLRHHSGFFQGSTIEGLPAQGHQWKYIFNQAHDNAAGYFGYLAIDFFGEHAWIGAQVNGNNTGPFEIYHTGFKPTASAVGATPTGFGVGEASPGSLIGDKNLDTFRYNGFRSYNMDQGDVGAPYGHGTAMDFGHIGNGGSFIGWAGQLYLGVNGSFYKRVNVNPGSFEGSTWDRIYDTSFNPLSDAGFYDGQPRDFNDLPVGFHGLIVNAGSSNVPPYSCTGDGHYYVEVQRLLGAEVVQRTIPFRNSTATAHRIRGLDGQWSAWVLDYSQTNKPTAADVGAISKNGDTMRGGSTIQDYGTGYLNLMGKQVGLFGGPIAGYLTCNAYFDGTWKKMDNSVASTHIEVAKGQLNLYMSAAGSTDPQELKYPIYHRGNKPTAADVDALSTTGGSVTGVVNSTAAGVVLSTIGGMLRSDDNTLLSLDGNSYSFLTSHNGAYLCQNSYWNGTNWLKYDNSMVSGHLYIGNGLLRFKQSDAGSLDPNQHDYYVYHTGYKPTAADIGAQPATSDRRLKTNIKEFSSKVLDLVKDIKVYTYNMRDQPGVAKIGTMAQDWEQKCPETILDVPIGDSIYKGLDSLSLISLLLKQIQELDQKIEQLGVTK